MVDFDEGTLLQDADMKAKIAAKHPYGEWVKNQVIELEDVVKANPTASAAAPLSTAPTLRRRAWWARWRPSAPQDSLAKAWI